MNILSLPPQCIDIVLDNLSNGDLLRLSTTCKVLNELINKRLYERIYYLPGYKFPDRSLGHTVISSEENLKKFLKSDKKNQKYEFINLSEEDEFFIEEENVTHNLNELGNIKRPGELFVPFDYKDYPKNYRSNSYLDIFEGEDESTDLKELITLSLVVKNSHSELDNEKILSKIDCDRLQHLELIIVDDGEDLLIFKTLVIFISKFRLKSLSIVYLNQFKDEKNNLRIMMINSLILNQLPYLKKLMIYLDMVNLNLVQLTLLQRSLLNFINHNDNIDSKIEWDFNCNLSNLEIDFVVLKELNFFKNFISNSSIIVLLFEEFIKINGFFNPILKKFNYSNFKMSNFNYQLDFENEFFYTNFFLKPKLFELLCLTKNETGVRNQKVFKKQKFTFFNIQFILKESKEEPIYISNISNYNAHLIESFKNDMNDINSIFGH